jgi:hypothetical protein
MGNWLWALDFLIGSLVVCITFLVVFLSPELPLATRNAPQKKRQDQEEAKNMISGRVLQLYLCRVLQGGGRNQKNDVRTLFGLEFL